MIEIETGLTEDDDGGLCLGSRRLERKCYGEYCSGCPDDECEVCKGAGYVTTNDGEMLLEFIARHTKPTESK